jgi:hypothetical protein
MATTRNHVDQLTSDEADAAREIVKDLPADQAPRALGLFSIVTLWKALARQPVSAQTAEIIRLRIAVRRA